MGDYQKRGDFGGGAADRKGGQGRPFGRPAFQGGQQGFGRSQGGDKPRQTFRATCATCGASCEVPFRPTGERPVYCRDCFAKAGGPAPAQGQRRTFDRPAFGDRSAPRPAVPHAHSGELAVVKKQLEALHTKLDTLLSLAQARVADEKHVGVKEALAHAIEPAPVKKKPAVKKKAVEVKKKATKKK